MTECVKHSGNINLLGGRLCLDFINTLDWRGRSQPVEYLHSFEDVIRWCAYLKFITPLEEETFYRLSQDNSLATRKALAYAVELRELLHKIFLGVIKKGNIQSADLLRLNRFIKPALNAAEIITTETGFELYSPTDTSSLKGLLNPVIWDAARLITSEERHRVKTCADVTCGYMFLDTSKNKSRQWCDMKGCGNRAKARKFYQKIQKK